MSKINQPVYASMSMMFTVIGVVSLISADGIQPGMHLSQHTCEIIVVSTGMAFLALAAACLIQLIRLVIRED